MAKKASVLIVMMIFWIMVPAAVSANPPEKEAPLAQTEEKTSPKEPKPMTDIHDIKPLEMAGVNPAIYRSAAWIVAGLLLCCLVAGLFYAWKKKHRKKVQAEAPVPPDKKAMQALNRISDLIQTDGREFYFRLSAVLREYIEGRYDIDAPGMTTEELLPRIQKLEIDAGLRQEIKDLILFSDPIKFAGYYTEVKKMNEDLALVRRFVSETGVLGENQEKPKNE